MSFSEKIGTEQLRFEEQDTSGCTGGRFGADASVK